MPTDSQTETIKAIQKRIREIRETAKLSQQEVADRLGIEMQAYSKYETRPSSQLPISLLEKFCNGLQADMHYVVTGKTFVETLPDNVQKVIRALEE